MNHALLADIYGGLGSLNSETNNFQGTYDCFMNEWEHLQAAFSNGQLQRPNILEVFGSWETCEWTHGTPAIPRG